MRDNRVLLNIYVQRYCMSKTSLHAPPPSSLAVNVFFAFLLLVRCKFMLNIASNAGLFHSFLEKYVLVNPLKRIPL